MNMPIVSIITGVYNGEKYLLDALNSIVNQSFTSFEYIIVNDGSSDQTASILSDFQQQDERVRVYHQDNQGLSTALNVGIKLSHGQYLVRMDADDIAVPNRIQEQVAYLCQYPDIVLLGTAYDLIDASGKYLKTHFQPVRDSEIRWQMLFHNAFCHSSVIINRSNIDENFLYYDQSLRYAQDFELWGRLLERGLGANLDRPLVKLRVHPDSVTRTFYSKQQAVANAICKRQVSKICPQQNLTDAEIDKLRSYFYRPAVNGDLVNLKLVSILLRLLRRFREDDDLDSMLLRDMHQRYICWSLRCVWAQKKPLFKAFMIALNAMRYEPALTLRCLVRLMQRMNGRFVRC